MRTSSKQLIEALTGAATAIILVAVLMYVSPTCKVESDPRKATGISLESEANLSGKYFQ